MKGEDIDMSVNLIIGVAFFSIFLFAIIFIFFVLTGFSEKGIERRLTKMGNAVTRAQANIVKNNEDIMTDTANKSANINKDAVKTMAHAIKEGFSEENGNTYCKYCGTLIDADSKFCKHCGKELN